MEWVTWLNTGVGIIGIIVGVIGWKSLSTAMKITNTIKASNGATVYQAKTINQGISEDTVRLIAKDMTKEEMCQLIIRLIPIHTDDDNCVGNRLRNGTVTADDFHKILDEIPTIYYGKTPPPEFPNMKDGNIWFDIE